MKGVLVAARAVTVPVGAPTIAAAVDAIPVAYTRQPPDDAANPPAFASTDTVVSLEPELLVVELREEVTLSPIARQVELEDEVAKRAELTLAALQSCSRSLSRFVVTTGGVARRSKGVQANGGRWTIARREFQEGEVPQLPSQD